LEGLNKIWIILKLNNVCTHIPTNALIVSFII
jgi:hypothetical protein